MRMTQHSTPTPTIGKLFVIWSLIGLQSFGGGASTNFLIQREFIDKRHWITMDELIHFTNLCFFAPGINLVALSILIGRRLGGTAGIFVSVVGMLLPSSIITCLLAAGFKRVEHVQEVQAILKGVVPATAGIMLLVGLKFAQPQLQRARKEGLFALISSVLLIAGCVGAIIVYHAPVMVILPTVALLGVMLFTRPLFASGKKEVSND